MGKEFRKKVIAFCPLVFMEVQVEIHKAFVYSVLLLSKKYDVTVIIDQNKRLKKYEEYGWIRAMENSGVKIVFIPRILKDYSKENKRFETIDYSWLDCFEGPYDYLYVYSIPLATQSLTDDTGGIDIVENCGYNERLKNIKCSWLSQQTKFKTYIIINELFKKFNPIVKQMIVDYLEPILIENLYPGTLYGNYKNGKIETLYLHENFYFRKGLIEEPKTYDFVFGYTVTYALRKYLSKLISENTEENDKFIIFAKDKYWKNVGRDDVVNQTEYFEYLAKSKFSFVVPANNSKEVSYLRILECFSRKCIPIIYYKVKIEKCFDNFEDIFEFYKRNNLFYNEEKDGSLNEFVSNLDYDKLINELINLDSFKMFLNKKEMRKKFYESFGE